MYKANPGSVSWAGGLAGGVDQLTAGMIIQAVGGDAGKFNYVAFGSGGEVLSQTLGGHVTVGMGGYQEFASQITTGKLRALGITPTVWHLNEGHAAFVALQRIHEGIEQGQSFDAALEAVRRSTVFTTHTPVPAGHDAFPFYQVEKHLAGSWGEIGEHRPKFLALGEYDNGSGSQFNMTALALRTSAYVNGVSALHGEVTRTMWRPMWPDLPADQIPVRSITNGVHVPTWMAPALSSPLDR